MLNAKERVIIIIIILLIFIHSNNFFAELAALDLQPTWYMSATSSRSSRGILRCSQAC